MQYETKIKLGSEVSFVICTIDDYTGKPHMPPASRMYLKNAHGEPIRKHDGHWVFCRLSPGKYHVSVVSKDFFDEALEVDSGTLEGDEKTMYVSLKPKPSYPFSQGATLIRFSLEDDTGKPISHASVNAVAITEGCAKGKLGKNGAGMGAAEIWAVSLTGKIFIGDELAIKGSEEDELELCRISDNSKGSKSLKLKEPLKRDHKRGEALMPIISTRTDERGEGVIYFRSCPLRQFEVRLEIVHGDKALRQRVSVEEGKTCYLGKLRLERA